MRFDHSLGFRKGVIEDAKRRSVLANKILQHRKFHAQGGYKRDRNLAFLKKENYFDLKKFLLQRLPKKGKLTVLDSGAGFLGVSSGLKRALGNKVFVTALNVTHPFTKKPLEVVKEKKVRVPYLGVDTAHKIVNFGPLVRGRIKAIDEVRVSAIENFKSKRKYDVILDFCGPLLYSFENKIAFERYLRVLSPNGIVITDTYYKGYLHVLYPNGIWVDPQSKKSFKLEFVELHNRAHPARVWGIEKVPLD